VFSAQAYLTVPSMKPFGIMVTVGKLWKTWRKYMQYWCSSDCVWLVKSMKNNI